MMLSPQLSLDELDHLDAAGQVLADSHDGHLHAFPVCDPVAVVHDRIYSVSPPAPVGIQELLQVVSPCVVEASRGVDEAARLLGW